MNELFTDDDFQRLLEPSEDEIRANRFKEIIGSIASRYNVEISARPTEEVIPRIRRLAQHFEKEGDYQLARFTDDMADIVVSTLEELSTLATTLDVAIGGDDKEAVRRARRAVNRVAKNLDAQGRTIEKVHEWPPALSHEEWLSFKNPPQWVTQKRFFFPKKV